MGLKDVIKSLMIQKNMGILGNLYYVNKMDFTYNSLCFEDVNLSLDEVQDIFNGELHDDNRVIKFFDLFDMMIDSLVCELSMSVVSDFCSCIGVNFDIKEVIKWYTDLDKVMFEDIIDLYVRISEFDGVIARIVLFRECLYNSVVPFYFECKDKKLILSSLDEYKQGRKENLIELCKIGQDNYEKLIDYYLGEE